MNIKSEMCIFFLPTAHICMCSCTFVRAQILTVHVLNAEAHVKRCCCSALLFTWDSSCFLPICFGCVLIPLFIFLKVFWDSGQHRTIVNPSLVYIYIYISHYHFLQCGWMQSWVKSRGFRDGEAEMKKHTCSSSVWE